MSAFRTGLVVMTIAVEHFCRLIAKYRPNMDAAIAFARSEAHISEEQATLVTGFLDGMSAVCAALKLLTGY